MHSPTTRNPGARAYLWTGIKIAVAFILIAIVLSRTDQRQLLELGRRISLPWLGLAFSLFCLLTLIRAHQFYVLIGRSSPYRGILQLIISQNAISNFVAASAGAAYYMILMNADEGIRIRRAALTFLIAKIGDLIAVWVLLGVASVFLWRQVEPLHALLLALMAGITVALVSFFLAVWLRQRSVDLLERLAVAAHLDRWSLVRRGLETLRSLADQDQHVVFRSLGTGLLHSFVYMAVTLLWGYANLKTFSASIPWMVIAFVNALLQLLSWVPIQMFGGLGVAELSSLYLYGMLGIPQSQMAPILVGARILFYAMNLVLLLYVPLNTRLFARPAKAER